MISENDKLTIPERYLKMEVSELRKEKEQLLKDSNTAIDAGVHKPEGEKDSSWFKRVLEKMRKKSRQRFVQ